MPSARPPAADVPSHKRRAQRVQRVQREEWVGDPRIHDPSCETLPFRPTLTPRRATLRLRPLLETVPAFFFFCCFCRGVGSALMALVKWLDRLDR